MNQADHNEAQSRINAVLGSEFESGLTDMTFGNGDVYGWLHNANPNADFGAGELGTKHNLRWLITHYASGNDWQGSDGTEKTLTWIKNMMAKSPEFQHFIAVHGGLPSANWPQRRGGWKNVDWLHQPNTDALSVKLFASAIDGGDFGGKKLNPGDGYRDYDYPDKATSAMYGNNLQYFVRGAPGNFFHQVAEEAGKVVDTVEKAVKDTVNAAIKVLKTIGEDVLFAPLLIFKPAMKKELDEKEGGYHGDGTILDITGKFLKSLTEHPEKHTFVWDGDTQYYNDFAFDKYNLDGYDSFGLPVAPVYVATPVGMACSAVGIPAQPPGLPAVANVLWGFLHKKAAQGAAGQANAFHDGMAAAAAAQKADEVSATQTFNVFGHKIRVAEFFGGNKTFWLIVVIAGLIFLSRYVYKKVK